MIFIVKEDCCFYYKMTEQERIDKNLRIKEAISATRAKREAQTCRVITVKIQENKLNNIQKEFLKMCFVEAKWLYNYILNLSNEGKDIFSIKYNDIDFVTHFDKNKQPIDSKLTHLSSQMQQSVLQGIVQNIKNLAKAKEKGNVVGSLNFISEYNSIDLKQRDVSYKIVSKGKIKIQGCKKPFHVNGLKQLKGLEDVDFANAKLLLKSSGHYIALTLYIKKENKNPYKGKIGIDMGCQTSITMSDGTKITCLVEESERLKKIQRKLSRTRKGSNNRYRIRKQLQKAYEKDDNRKNDAAHKVCHMLQQYAVSMQDEQLNAWKVKHGKKIQHSILGRVKAWLLKQEDTIVLNKFVPTSKLCTCCGHVHNALTIKDRTFVCPSCGYSEDRDVHAAQNMVWISENIVGAGRTDFKRVEFDEAIRQILKHEAANSLD